MKIIEKTFPLDAGIFELYKSNMPDGLFIDIETTGLSSTRSKIYLVGCLTVNEQLMHLTQFLCERDSDEYELLYKLSHLLSNYNCVIHYNGGSFDMPFIKSRMMKYRINYTSLSQYDMYQKLRPFKHIFGLDDLKLKTVEKAAGIQRYDTFSGGDLILLYDTYSQLSDTHPEKMPLEKTLLLHNEEDMTSMVKLLPFLSTIWHHEKLRSNDINFHLENIAYSESYVIYQFKMTGLNLAFFTKSKEYELIGLSETDSFELTLPIEYTTLKLSLEPYTDYCYFPEKDIALHYAVAQYEAKGTYQKATKSTAYTKYEGRYLIVPQPIHSLNKPCFWFDRTKGPYAYLFEELTFIDDHKRIIVAVLSYLSIVK